MVKQCLWVLQGGGVATLDMVTQEPRKVNPQNLPKRVSKNIKRSMIWNSKVFSKQFALGAYFSKHMVVKASHFGATYQSAPQSFRGCQAHGTSAGVASEDRNVETLRIVESVHIETQTGTGSLLSSRN